MGARRRRHARLAGRIGIGLGLALVASAAGAQEPGVDLARLTPPAGEPSLDPGDVARSVEEGVAPAPRPTPSTPLPDPQPTELVDSGVLGAAPQAPPPTGPAAELSPPPARGRRLIVIDAATYGIDPVVGRHVTERIRITAAEMGYVVLSPEATVQAAQKLQMPYPPAPADLFRVSWVSRSDRGAFARVWAQGGQYVVELTIASTDGTGPFIARGTAGAADLHEEVARLVHELLPPVGVWDLASAEQLRTARAPAAPAQLSLGPPSQALVVRPTTEKERRQLRIPERRWDLALRSEVAIGTSNDHFNNALLGSRVDFRITNEVLIGAFFGYANLRSRDGRANNVLAYGLVEDRVRLSPKFPLSMPLRFALGYLPFNGPYVQLSAGLNIGLSDRVELGFDILAPTFWFIPNGRAFSLNMAAEVIFRL